MEQTKDVSPAQTAPSTPHTTQSAKTQSKLASEPANEDEFKQELKIKVLQAQRTPAMLLVPKLGMQGSIDAKLRVASRLLLQKIEWVDIDGNKCEAELGDAFKSASQYFMGTTPSNFIKVVPKELSGAAQDAVATALSENFHVAFNFSVVSPKFVWHVPSSPAYMQEFVQAVSEAREKLGIELSAWFDTAWVS